MKKASDLLKTMDFDMGEVGIQDIITFTSKVELEVVHIKEVLGKAFESSELEILKIEGGKVE